MTDARIDPKIVDEGCEPTSMGHVWRYELAESESFDRAKADALKRHLARQPGSMRSPYTPRPLFRERRTLLPGLLLGYAIGLVTGAAFAVLVLRLAAMGSQP